ncbi:hypothetical protein L1887_02624 [Cichorium endivia]|nr:hypothetical protein L1887_02624 [Cichorium endivia]
MSYTSFLYPVNKHTDTAQPLYSITIMTSYVNETFQNPKFLIDIDAPFTWHDCILVWFNYGENICPSNKVCTSPVSCEEYQCTDVRTTYSYRGPSCPPLTNSYTLPGWGFCTCPVNVMNPVNGICSQAELNFDTFEANTSDGRNPSHVYQDILLNAACAPSTSFESFPTNVTGVMAFSTSPYAVPASFFQSQLKTSLAICLPSTTSSPGILFFGAGPFYLLPHSNIDVRSLLTYTPLLKHPDSFGYFIGVTDIVIRGRSVNISGNTTTKLSTTEPYTILRTDIYNRMVRRFAKVTKRIPLASPVRPFGLCFRTFENGTRVGLKVPDIDLSLKDGKNWTITTSNSMKQITEDVACLAFVDGGANIEHGIVIGTFQLEDNFILLDLENSTLGLSSSLLNKDTSCANFNFTGS